MRSWPGGSKKHGTLQHAAQSFLARLWHKQPILR